MVVPPLYTRKFCLLFLTDISVSVISKNIFHNILAEMNLLQN